MVTRLYLIRHGETKGADTKRYKGHIDVPLSNKGIQQMERVSKYVHHNTEHSLPRFAEQGRGAQNTDIPTHPSPSRGEGKGGGEGHPSNRVNAVYCSDLSRAVKSAEIIARPHGLKPIIMPELRERNFGIWEGMSFDEIRVKYPEEFEAWSGNPLKFKPMQGESTIEVRDRVINALNRILNEVQNSSSRSNSLNGLNNLNSLNDISIVVVSHGGVNRVILCHLLGIPLENIFRIEQDFGALNIMEFYDKYPVVKLVNCRV